MELQVNQDRIRPSLSGGIEQQKNISSILVYSDVKSKNSQGKEEAFLNLQIPMGLLIPDPDIQRSKYEADENNENNSSLTGIYSEGNITKFNDDEFYDFYGVFSSLSIQSVQESETVMAKIHQNFSGVWNAFFFGTKPKFYTFNGIIIDYQDYPFYQEFSMAFERYISGRAAIEKRLKTKIVYDNKIASGFLLGFQTAHDANSESIKRFSLTAVIYDIQWLRINYHKTNNKTYRGQNLFMNKGNFISVLPQGMPSGETDVLFPVGQNTAVG